MSTPELLGVVGVEGVLGVDERRDAAGALRVRHGVQGDRRLAGGLRAVDLDDPAARQPTDAEGDVEGDRAGRDDLDRRPGVVPEAHHRSLAELAVDLGEGGVERLLAVCGCGHVLTSGTGALRNAVRTACGRRSRRRRSGRSGCWSSPTTLEAPTDSAGGRDRPVGDGTAPRRCGRH